ncbi:MAG TPA: hypothetical protein PLE87_01560 [Phycisphaerae bacterium]|nr:hypothetical protein [Phycisphaerae bacterium]
MSHFRNGTILVLLVVLACVGCTDNQTGLDRGSTIQLGRDMTPCIRFSSVRAWQEEGRLIVTGTIQRGSDCHQRLCGDVLIQVMDESGQVIGETHADLVPLHAARQFHAQSRFRAAMDISVPANATVALRYGCGQPSPDDLIEIVRVSGDVHEVTVAQAGSLD